MRIEYTDKNQPIQFQTVAEKQLRDDGTMQEEEFELKVSARYIKIRVLSGYHNFISVHSVIIKADS